MVKVERAQALIATDLTASRARLPGGHFLLDLVLLQCLRAAFNGVAPVRLGGNDRGIIRPPGLEAALT